MPKVITAALRELVVFKYQLSHTITSISEDLLLARNTVRRVIDDYVITGSLDPLPLTADSRRSHAKLSEADMRWLGELAHHHTNLYLFQYADVYNNHHPGANVTGDDISRAFKVGLKFHLFDVTQSFTFIYFMNIIRF